MCIARLTVQVKFITPIFHVNVDEKDNLMCIPITTQAEWKPTMRMTNGTCCLLCVSSAPPSILPTRLCILLLSLIICLPRAHMLLL